MRQLLKSLYASFLPHLALKHVKAAFPDIYSSHSWQSIPTSFPTRFLFPSLVQPHFLIFLFSLFCWLNVSPPQLMFYWFNVGLSKIAVFICINESYLKMMEKIFYFMLKTISVLEIFTFLS